MKSYIDWVKNHKLVCVLIVVIIFLLSKNSSVRNSVSRPIGGINYPSAKMSAISSDSVGMMSQESIYESAPTTNIKDRMVIQDSYLSLQVIKVADIQKQIIKKAEELGGYMVNSSIDNPNDIASSTVIVRIPAKQLDSALLYYRSLAVKVVSENLQGQDVTDQYTDLQTQLKTYEKTKAKFEEMLDRATLIQDILQIQREIINTQSSIDSIIGQQNYLEKNAEMAKITVYLSSDEMSLPYAPTESWRPEVIFKEAVRSVVKTLRSVGTLMIWLVVFSVIWLPALLIFLFIKKRRKLI